MPSRRRIGVNALYLIPGGVGGTEIYLRNLLAALARIDSRNEYVLFTNKETGADICPAAPNFQTVVTPIPGKFRAARLLWEQLGLPLQTVTRRIDVLFCPGFSSPLFCRGGKATVIHDLQHKRHPKNFGFLERQAWDLIVSISARYSDRLITVSENSRSDLLEIYDLPPARVRLIRHGVEDDFFGLKRDAKYPASLLRDAGVPSCRYLLAVSTLHPHKNWTRLLEAFQRLVQQGRPEHLVIAGLRGKAWEDVGEQIRTRGLTAWVHIVGWQPRKVLLGLYKFADALVFPSIFEGFGMPVAEALAAEVPVVCSDIPPLREIADGAALFFDASSTDDLVEQLLQVLDNAPRRERLVERGKELASRFSWGRAAEETLAVLLEAARD
jgi:glycosyltransferase involved in cell wall biosynthesis